jgi:hypothetical protein
MSPCRTLQLRSPARSRRARQQQHVDRHVDAQPTLDARPEQFENAPRSGAEIEQRAERLVGEHVADRALHRLIGDMQLADAVPLGGVRAEISLSGVGARAAHRGQSLAVAHHHRILRIEPCHQRAGNLRAAASFSQPEERPGAFAETLHQPGFNQQPEMPRNARLRLPQDVGEVGDGQFGLRHQRQHAQPRRLARRLEGGVEGVERQVGSRLVQGRYPII